MIDLPILDPGDVSGYADWVELQTMAGDHGSVSQADIERTLAGGGRYGFAPSELYAMDRDAPDQHDHDADDQAERFVDEVWAALRLRSLELGTSYPLDVASDSVSRRADTWRNTPSFTHLILTTHTSRYPEGHMVPRVQGYGFRRLFEKVVQASQVGLLGGEASRFGVPVEDGWPAGTNNRIARFAEELGGLFVLRTNVDSKAGDRTLDVAARLRLGGHSAGTLALLTQCATGKNWEQKRGEPALARWSTVIDWDGVMIRAVAVPWWLEPTQYSKYFRYFDSAIVFDRRRLLAGEPDDHLDANTQNQIEAWCAAQIAALPSAA